MLLVISFGLLISCFIGYVFSAYWEVATDISFKLFNYSVLFTLLLHSNKQQRISMTRMDCMCFPNCISLIFMELKYD